MTVIENVRKYFYVKSRPRSYRASGTPYAVGGNRGAVLSAFPRAYPRTSQQKKVARVASECGIKKGISKSDLMTKMVDCVGPKMRS